MSIIIVLLYRTLLFKRIAIVHNGGKLLGMY